MKRAFFKKLLKYAGYAGVFLFSFIFFLCIGFPYGILEAKISSMVKEKLSLEFSARKISSYRVTGLKLRGIKLSSAQKATVAGGDEDKKGGGIELKIDEINARINILPLIRGKTLTDFKAKVFGGIVEGRLERKERGAKINSRIEKLQVPLLLQVKKDIDLKAEGSINCEVELNISGKNIRSASGLLTIATTALSVKEGEIKGYELPSVDLGEIKGKIIVERGRASFQDFKAQSKDLEATLDGYLLLNPNFMLSTVRLQLRVKPTSEFMQRNKAIGSFLPFIAKARSRSGFYLFTIYGPLRSLNARSG